MKALDVLKQFASVALTVACPAAAPLVAAVNQALPGNRQLGRGATGSMVEQALDMLDPSKKAEILAMEFKHEEVMVGHQVSAMNTANTNTNENYQETRAYIAKGSFHILSAATLLSAGSIFVSTATSDCEALEELTNSWPLVLAILGPFVGLLNAYMGVLKSEYRDRLNAANGKTAFGSLAALIGTIKKK